MYTIYGAFTDLYPAETNYPLNTSSDLSSVSMFSVDGNILYITYNIEGMIRTTRPLTGTRDVYEGPQAWV